jgi:hypothetical protein
MGRQADKLESDSAPCRYGQVPPPLAHCKNLRIRSLLLTSRKHLVVAVLRPALRRIPPLLLFAPDQPLQNKPGRDQYGDQEKDLPDVLPGAYRFLFIRLFLLCVHSRRVVVLSFFLQQDQQSDKDYGAEHKEIAERNEGHPDPEPIFRIGCFPEEVRKACYVSLGNGIAHNEKEEEDKDA